jgi:hypothetical protein
MADQKQTTVKLCPTEKEALDRLSRALKSAYGAKASREDIVGAMAHGVTVHQLSGMLSEYLKHDDWGRAAAALDPGVE